MGPEFEKGDGRLRPSLQQRLPGAEGPPEGCSTAPRHAACGGPIPSWRATSYLLGSGQVYSFFAWPALMMKFCKNLAGPCGAPTYLPTYLPYLWETKKEITRSVKVGYYTN